MDTSWRNQSGYGAKSDGSCRLIVTDPLDSKRKTIYLGNSAPIAAKHYLQVTDADFEKASAQAARIPARSVAERGAMEQTSERAIGGNVREKPQMTVADNYCPSVYMPRSGLEPETR